MSAGTANPTTCPRCLGPLAYGHAGATRIFLGSCCDKDRLLLGRTAGEGHDTSRNGPFREPATQQERCSERQQRDGGSDERWKQKVTMRGRSRGRTCARRASQ